jgi:hypothetical protein
VTPRLTLPRKHDLGLAYKRISVDFAGGTLWEGLNAIVAGHVGTWSVGWWQAGSASVAIDLYPPGPHREDERISVTRRMHFDAR